MQQPPSPHGALWRWFAAWVALPTVSIVMMKLATAVDRPLMRLTGGRLRLSFVIPVLLLRVRGRKTGQWREVPLMYVPDGESVLLLASNAGQGRLPGWYLNLRESPHVEVVLSGLPKTMSVMELSGVQREKAWEKAVNLYPGYAVYQQRTPYPIPVVRLSGIEQV